MTCTLYVNRRRVLSVLSPALTLSGCLNSIQPHHSTTFGKMDCSSDLQCVDSIG